MLQHGHYKNMQVNKEMRLIRGEHDTVKAKRETVKEEATGREEVGFFSHLALSSHGSN